MQRARFKIWERMNGSHIGGINVHGSIIFPVKIPLVRYIASCWVHLLLLLSFIFRFNRRKVRLPNCFPCEHSDGVHRLCSRRWINYIMIRYLMIILHAQNPALYSYFLRRAWIVCPLSTLMYTVYDMLTLSALLLPQLTMSHAISAWEKLSFFLFLSCVRFGWNNTQICPDKLNYIKLKPDARCMRELFTGVHSRFIEWGIGNALYFIPV